MTIEDEIIAKHAAAARAELEAQARKSAEEKEAQTLEREIGDLSAKLEPMFKAPSKYGAQLPQLSADLKAKWARYDELTGKGPRKDWQTAGNSTFTVVGGMVVK